MSKIPHTVVRDVASDATAQYENDGSVVIRKCYNCLYLLTFLSLQATNQLTALSAQAYTWQSMQYYMDYATMQLSDNCWKPIIKSVAKNSDDISLVTSIWVHRAVLVSVSVAFSQPPAYTARPRVSLRFNVFNLRTHPPLIYTGGGKCPKFGPHFRPQSPVNCDALRCRRMQRRPTFGTIVVLEVILVIQATLKITELNCS